ncbi:uncharacterized protein LOC127750459 [Frankliniella occidentalis]|uniref:Uncharacterized protein LOC127750459 n=1 Tax=Frankliniella occidentalis TaxID=133901 RepID=A0A9C6X2U5_FRAOC|nr:uncharacterized protein LOC127750459 [Frankliniella occidentalis]
MRVLPRSSPILTIFNCFSLQNPYLREYFTLKSLQNHVQYERSKRYPPTPRFVQEAATLLTNPDNGYLARTVDDQDEFFQGQVGAPGEESLVFASRRLLAMIQRDDVVQGDDTYKIRPYLNKSRHVFIVSLYSYGQMFPIAYAVMTKGTTTAYAAVLNKLKELGLRPQAVVTDWDDAQRGAWKEVFPRIELWGCYFHFLRAIYRKAKKKSLASYLSDPDMSQGEVARILRMCAAIPRLSAGDIEEGYNRIWKMARDLPGVPDNVAKKLMSFLRYFKREWVSKPEEVTIKGRHVHTTSGQEGLHKWLNTCLNNMDRPSFWKFMGIIRRDEHKSYYELNGIAVTGHKTGTMSGKRQKTKNFNSRGLKFDADIIEATKCFVANQSITSFLTLAAAGVREAMHFISQFGDDVELPE